MRDLQTSGIVGVLASKVEDRHSDRPGEINDKKNVAVLLTVLVSIRATKGPTGGYTYQGNKVVFASPLVITGGNEISICIPRHASHQFQLLMS
ncbi:hypothetical protein ABSL22_003335 [Escherichia coli]|nr:hypothetical protein [Escherichia coli]EHB7666185.1 hypothetical protein [Escherichia coli]EHD2967274.1 hypothetical protein [Escherichia coli]EHE9876658.1 hypothetical protein [Escherichia coli]EII9937301.1 hypothetical protein [Escherichia coli]